MGHKGGGGFTCVLFETAYPPPLLPHCLQPVRVPILHECTLVCRIQHTQIIASKQDKLVLFFNHNVFS